MGLFHSDKKDMRETFAGLDDDEKAYCRAILLFLSYQV